MSAQFDDLIRSALLDLARRAKPTDLAPAALADAARRRRAQVAGGVVATALALAAGSAPTAIVGVPSLGDRLRPAPAPTHTAPPTGCAGSPHGAAAGSSPPCRETPASTEITAPSRVPKQKPHDRRAPTYSENPDGPGNRPKPKPTKPHRTAGPKAPL